MALGSNESEIWDVISYFHTFLEPALIEWPKNSQKIISDIAGLGYTVESFFRVAMQPCHAMLKFCVWYGHRMPCEKLFHVIKSTKGFCYSFNNVLAMKFNKCVTFSIMRYVFFDFFFVHSF